MGDQSPMSKSITGCPPAAAAAAAMFLPIGSRQQKSQEAFARLAEIREVLHAVQRGTLDERRAIQQIEEIATGAADRIVRVGETHRPDVTTSREGE